MCFANITAEKPYHSLQIFHLLDIMNLLCSLAYNLPLKLCVCGLGAGEAFMMRNNQYYNVTDIKHYQPTEGAKAKKESHLHSFMPNTITIVTDILLSPSCKPHIKNLSLETVKIGTTYAQNVKPAQKNSLDPGKTFKKKIVNIGDPSNTLLVVDTTGNKESVTLEIIVKNVTVKNK